MKDELEKVQIANSCRNSPTAVVFVAFDFFYSPRQPGDKMSVLTGQ